MSLHSRLPGFPFCGLCSPRFIRKQKRLPQRFHCGPRPKAPCDLLGSAGTRQNCIGLRAICSSHLTSTILTVVSDAEVAACFVEAMNVARRQNARLWELRAAISLARLWRDHGKRNEARDILAPVYGWFTEGFDTLDLKEAKALLDKLAS
jgi:hypothetical protein